MELVYLWVEDYKNIQKQGFNFSPRFHCEYKENKLTIDKKDDCIPDFFAENINITAIVGKNGSGKSSILKAFIETFISSSSRYKGEKYTKSELFLREEDNKAINIKKDNKKPDVVYWDYSITDESFLNIEVYNKYSKFNNDFVILPSKVDKNIEAKIDLKKDMQMLAYGILQVDINLEIIKKFFNPSQIIVASKKKFTEFEEYKSKEYKEYFQDYFEDEEEYNHYYKLDIRDKDKLIKIINKEKKDKIIIDFISDKKRLIFLSFGEIQLLKILINLQYLINIKNNNNKDIIFLLDEIELGLHPQWQKKLISYLSKMTISNRRKVQFILTTHSPFMLSDLPKQNIIFLDTYKEDDVEVKNEKQKEGNCRVVRGVSQTFGANIHTLLSDSFFMENGLMGEFALSKIQSIVDFYGNVKNGKKKQLDYDKVKKEFYFIRDNIGEEYIKGVITNHIEFIEEKLGDKSFKEKRIMELKKELAKLETDNDKD
jgi:predicted ATPase